MYTIEQRFIKFNRPKKTLKPIGIILHETATPNDTVENQFNYFNLQNRNASAHVFIDQNKILQFIPFTEIAWHAGRTANNSYIGIEMCHATNQYNFEEIYKKTIWLFTHIYLNVINPKIYNINEQNLMTHEQVSLKWKETNHVDPTSYLKKFGKNIEDFRFKVQEQINNYYFNFALSKLANTSNYWNDNARENKTIEVIWLKKLIENFLKIFNLSFTLKNLKELKIINDLDYWQKAFLENKIDGKYVNTIIIRMGQKLSGG
jgi:N-acetylmuramoyl-L-alanine amidase CwlA